MKKGIFINCKKCNKEFYVSKYRIGKAKFCSKQCHGTGQQLLFTKKCMICEKQFSFKAWRDNRAKYCSRSCYYKSMVSKGTVEKSCPFCGVKFKTSPSHDKVCCSWNCRKQYLLLKIPLSEKRSFSKIRQAMQSRGMVKKCFDCGYHSHPEVLGIHHQDGNRKNNILENLIVLCANCHSLRHKKHIVHSSLNK